MISCCVATAFDSYAACPIIIFFLRYQTRTIAFSATTATFSVLVAGGLDFDDVGLQPFVAATAGLRGRFAAGTPTVTSHHGRIPG